MECIKSQFREKNKVGGGGGATRGRQLICFLQCLCLCCAIPQRPPFLPLASDYKQRAGEVVLGHRDAIGSLAQPNPRMLEIGSPSILICFHSYLLMCMCVCHTWGWDGVACVPQFTSLGVKDNTQESVLSCHRFGGSGD